MFFFFTLETKDQSFCPQIDILMICNGERQSGHVLVFCVNLEWQIPTAIITGIKCYLHCLRQMYVFLTIYRRGDHFAVDSVSPISIVLHLKLTSTVTLQELYSIEKCSICLGYLSSTLLACRAVARPHIKLEICIKSFSVE